MAVLITASVSIAEECADDPKQCTPKKLCDLSTADFINSEDGIGTIWSGNPDFSEHVEFAQSLGMKCGVITIVDSCDSGPLGCKIDQLCEKATTIKDGQAFWNNGYEAYVDAAKEYGLACGVEINTLKRTELADEAIPITLFGVNFDMNTDEVKEIIAKRFSCKWGGYKTITDKYCKTDGGQLLTMRFNNLGEIDELSFKCDTYKGCTFSMDEIFETLSNSIRLQRESKDSVGQICGVGDLGERICVFKDRVSLMRSKFRVGVVSFE